MIKIDGIKFGFAVRAGTAEDVYFNSSKYDMYLDPNGDVHIKAKLGTEWTHCNKNNVAWLKSNELDAQVNEYLKSKRPDKAPVPLKAKQQAPSAII